MVNIRLSFLKLCRALAISPSVCGLGYLSLPLPTMIASQTLLAIVQSDLPLSYDKKRQPWRTPAPGRRPCSVAAEAWLVRLALRVGHQRLLDMLLRSISSLGPNDDIVTHKEDCRDGAVLVLERIDVPVHVSMDDFVAFLL
jgi:hypothetical protein